MAYRDCKVLPKSAIADKKLCVKAFNIAKCLKHDEYKTWTWFNGL